MIAVQVKYRPLAPEDRTAQWKAVRSRQERLVRRYRGRVSAALTKAVRRVAAALARSRREEIDLSGLGVLYAEMYEEALVGFASATFRAIERGLKQVDDDLLFSFQEEAQRFMATHGARRISLVGESIEREVIARVLAEGLEEAWGPVRVARELRQHWEGLSVKRAERITRTEIIAASNHGQIKGAEAIEDRLGVELRKTWLATPDGRVRESHAAASGQARAMPEAFSVGGAALMQPGDPSGPAEEVINCRCTVTFEVA